MTTFVPLAQLPYRDTHHMQLDVRQFIDRTRAVASALGRWVMSAHVNMSKSTRKLE